MTVGDVVVGVFLFTKCCWGQIAKGEGHHRKGGTYVA